LQRDRALHALSWSISTVFVPLTTTTRRVPLAGTALVCHRPPALTNGGVSLAI
jgi:hypothetical protein